jgi:hypothetical protein
VKEIVTLYWPVIMALDLASFQGLIVEMAVAGVERSKPIDAKISGRLPR